MQQDLPCTLDVLQPLPGTGGIIQEQSQTHFRFERIDVFVSVQFLCRLQGVTETVLGSREFHERLLYLAHVGVKARAIACFDLALADVGLPNDDALTRALHDYFAWATTTTMAKYHQSADDVPNGLSIPHWSWDGLQE